MNKPYHIAIFALGILLLLLLLLTQFGARGLRNDTVQVKLGFATSPSARAQALDIGLLNVLERGHFGVELRQRLDRLPHRVQLAPFWADTCEVQQIDFERFARWQQRSDATPSAPSILFSSSTGHRIAGLLHSPASGVNYNTATAYCEAAGGRLPWAEEWEAIAVGHEGRLYPWGNTFDDSPWPYQSAYRNATQSCALHPQTATPEGVHDLVSNAMEWSQGQRDLPATERQPGAHGASAVRTHGRALYALSAAWLNIKPQTRSHHLGFRCVYPQPPATSLPWGAMPKTTAIAGGNYSVGLPADLRLARVAILLPAAQHRKARDLVDQPHEVRRLEISRCEVSRDQYRTFLRHPLVQLGLFANEYEPRWQDYTPQNWQQQLQQPELPVSGINWWAADAFARWTGGRLPQAEEWQLLAAGPNANLYPWGNDYIAGNAATGDQTDSGLHPCATMTTDNASGIYDLAGNLSEWTRSVTAEQGDYAAWVQGGNWLLPGQTTARSVFGRPVPLNHRSDSIGFRVVYDE